MAFIMAANGQLVFFEKLFGAADTTTKMVKILLNGGVKFETGLYFIKATYKGQSYIHSLTKGSTSLLKGTVEPAVMTANKTAIATWIENLSTGPLSSVTTEVTVMVGESTTSTNVFTGLEDTTSTAPTILGMPPVLYNLKLTGMNATAELLIVIKTIRLWTGGTLLEAKKQAEALQAGTPVILNKPVLNDAAQMQLKEFGAKGVWAELVVTNTVGGMWAEGAETAPVPPKSAAPTITMAKPKPVPSVIELRKAQALGQQVKGTSSGSVYHTVAYNDRVKIAARIYKAGSVSIRAEWEGATPDELNKLKAGGLVVKGNYASTHFSSDGVPPGRVVGAFVVDLGIDWKEVVTNAAQLVVE